MIEIENLTKTYGGKTAVDDVSFTVRPGRVTGFLGPNGAGKSTTMRLLVGLESATSGHARVNGRPYAEHRAPLSEVGVLLDAKAVHPRRTARAHLSALAATHGIPRSRVQEVVDLTGLGAAADKRVGGFSLGMGQRLGIAAALIGDPHTVVLDEPVNGLDPEGVVWVRHLAKYLASEGRTVFLSSHLMSEMAQTADHLVVIGRGRILADAPIGQLLAGERNRTRVRTTDREALRRALREEGAEITEFDDDGALVTGPAPRRIAEAALSAGVLIYELTPQTETLEDVYMAMTQDEVEYRSGGAPVETTRAPWAGAAARTGDRA
ncbi:ATP-binding cassette domain-containing protein [Kocuria sediminis]|uniref:ATP-binding cassette domain-containing protein n=1 Tax=Kocuria sediminis TaxID=1038857 RepID=A0A6N8GL14_9MICC|nr:ATP-binding cassette domain-containing protein [Kocuria sediminis]